MSEGNHDQWLSVVNGVIRDSPRNVMVDVCCGKCAVTRHLNYAVVECCDLEPIEVGGFLPAGWKFSQRSAIHFLKEMPCKYADLVVCSDGLEHFTKPLGKVLLREMERVGKLALVFTPTGDQNIDTESTDPHAHKSSWTPEDFAKLGWDSDRYDDWHPLFGWGAIFAWNSNEPRYL